jgi:hypothetical protein
VRVFQIDVFAAKIVSRVNAKVYQADVATVKLMSGMETEMVY